MPIFYLSVALTFYVEKYSCDHVYYLRGYISFLRQYRLYITIVTEKTSLRLILKGSGEAGEEGSS